MASQSPFPRLSSSTITVVWPWTLTLPSLFCKQHVPISFKDLVACKVPSLRVQTLYCRAIGSARLHCRHCWSKCKPVYTAMFDIYAYSCNLTWQTSAIWKLGHLNHVAIAVPDLEKSTLFYKNIMGGQVSEVQVCGGRNGRLLFCQLIWRQPQLV